MAFQFHQGGFTNIADDSADSRVSAAMRKTKRETNGPHATKRVALGTITNQRVQPSRAAKPKQVNASSTFSGFGQDENQVGKSFGIAASQGFTIHVDDEPEVQITHVIKPPADSSDVNLQLNPAVTSLAETAYERTDSPMCLDVSMEERPHLTPGEEREAIILTVPEYTGDIYTYLREAERRHRPKPEYMRKQPDITTNMRCILVDWLVEVAEEYKLHRETLCLAVSYIDRFLSQMSVLRGKLQLVGAACMFLAAKYEEIYPPDVGEFVYITDDTYTKKQVLRMEHLVLKVLSFDVAVPTANCFCERFLEISGADDQTKSLAMYLVELTLIDIDPYLKFLPSEIAASAVCLANHTLGHQTWSYHMQQSTGYSVKSLELLIHAMHKTFTNAPNHPQQAVREKYKSSKYHQVSTLSPRLTFPTGAVH
ncbi:G2/mitotic-specific cyclin-A [Lingula anatina]|uniref:G2/mitotic-specific cyclin-A n=1 Tax=Lingula anatina TaxID=7574 RepID=A0A1S3J048_LINAN|nr:G2/mitotic-specific cyclin-A [Lingula anatina]|eukprot:XP_013403633.1 G2/mitotic-specific cyclin-A [Lingula anatina]